MILEQPKSSQCPFCKKICSEDIFIILNCNHRSCIDCLKKSFIKDFSDFNGRLALKDFNCITKIKTCKQGKGENGIISMN